jgi:hypothetical protein
VPDDRIFQNEVTSPDPTKPRAMTDLDQFRAELAGSLAGLSPSQRLKAAREMADRLAVVLAAIERGEIGASATETARSSFDLRSARRHRGRLWNCNGVRRQNPRPGVERLRSQQSACYRRAI